MRKNDGSNIKTLCVRMKPVLCVIFVLRVMIRIMYTKNYVFEIILKCFRKIYIKCHQVIHVTVKFKYNVIYRVS